MRREVLILMVNGGVLLLLHRISFHSCHTVNTEFQIKMQFMNNQGRKKISFHTGFNERELARPTELANAVLRDHMEVDSTIVLSHISVIVTDP